MMRVPAQAEAIRTKLIDNIARAGIPGPHAPRTLACSPASTTLQCLMVGARVTRQGACGTVHLAGRPLEEWRRLLHIVIVGGGPTGVEVAGELTDFINQDLKRLYPERAKAMR